MKYKKILCGILAAFIAVTSAEGNLFFAKAPVVQAAYDTSSESNFEFNEDTATIEKYVGSEEEVVIPSEINGVSVKAIGEDAFSSNEYITEVIIPDGVETIGAEAFLNCPNLQEIFIPDDVEHLGRLAFFMCENLEEVELGSGISVIGENTFYGCASLESITLPDSVTEIGAHAFAECAELEVVEIPGSVTVIEEEAFKNCVSIKKITIPSSVKSFGEEVFAGNNNLTIICDKDSPAYSYAQSNGLASQLQNPTKAPTKAPEKKPTATPKPSKCYDITYILKGGYFKDEVMEQYDGSYSIRLPKPVRKGYEFAGWYTESSYKNKVSIIKVGTTGDKKFYAKWQKVKKPSRPAISSVKNSKSKQMTVKLKKKVSGADGYEMVYATNASFTKNKKTVRFTATSKTVKKLTKNKKYYVKVRAYTLDSTNSRVYGSYCLLPKSVKITK